MSLATNIQDVITRVATEFKSHKSLINGNAADLSALTTTDKTNLVSAVNEVKASIQPAGASIDDAAIATTTSWSSSKTDTEIKSAVAGIVDSAGSDLDTLKELGDALGNDKDFGVSVNAALGNRVRYDAAQTLTAGQKIQATDNIGAATVLQVGDTTTNFVTTFNAGLL